MLFKLAAASVYMGDEELNATGIKRINHKYLDELKNITTVKSVMPTDEYEFSGYILIDIPDLNTLMRIIKAVSSDVVIGEAYSSSDERYPYKITIYDSYLE
ncbi:hypothetical protein [Lactobacillus crispatus]|uniref:hypothetical protein n=1 Tax=Lactobacillus crispatus TaxID=47770 RepID=UPI0011D1EE7B|nr:hypothetical protein [Lactobacillus crispatus]